MAKRYSQEWKDNISKSLMGKYCGSLSKNYKGIIKKNCLFCNKEIEGVSWRMKKIRFCSPICGLKFMHKNHPERWNKQIEIMKGNKINLGRKHSEEYKKKYSIRFSGKDNPHYGKIHTKEVIEKCRIARMKQKIPYRNTSIELRVKEFLNNLHIPYEMHKSIMKITQPDFFIEPNLCIYCDGDYWHNLPIAIERDKKINEILRFAGYRIIRLWEHEINMMDINLFKNIISKEVN